MTDAMTEQPAPAVTGDSTDTPSTPQSLARGRVRMGVAPTDVDQAWRLAQYIAMSDLVPKGYKGKPADVLVAIQFGMEVGLPPMAALNSIFVANGRPSLWGDGLLAVIVASPHYVDHDEGYLVGGEEREYLTPEDLKKDDTMAICRFWRRGHQKPRTATFSIAQAKKAKLWDKDAWLTFPDRMLQMRARGFAGRDAFPDVLRGVRTAEETQDDPSVSDRDPEPPKIVRRLSETVISPPVSETVVKGAPFTVAAFPPAVTDEAILEPVCVKAVDEFLGGFVIHLANGVQVEAEREADALELDKFAGTTSKVRLTVTRKDAVLILKGFAIAD